MSQMLLSLQLLLLIISISYVAAADVDERPIIHQQMKDAQKTLVNKHTSPKNYIPSKSQSYKGTWAVHRRRPILPSHEDLRSRRPKPQQPAPAPTTAKPEFVHEEVLSSLQKSPTFNRRVINGVVTLLDTSSHSQPTVVEPRGPAPPVPSFSGHVSAPHASAVVPHAPAPQSFHRSAHSFSRGSAPSPPSPPAPSPSSQLAPMGSSLMTSPYFSSRRKAAFPVRAHAVKTAQFRPIALSSRIQAASPVTTTPAPKLTLAQKEDMANAKIFDIFHKLNISSFILKTPEFSVRAVVDPNMTQFIPLEDKTAAARHGLGPRVRVLRRNPHENKSVLRPRRLQRPPTSINSNSRKPSRRPTHPLKYTRPVYRQQKRLQRLPPRKQEVHAFERRPEHREFEVKMTSTVQPLAEVVTTTTTTPAPSEISRDSQKRLLSVALAPSHDAPTTTALPEHRRAPVAHSRNQWNQRNFFKRAPIISTSHVVADDNPFSYRLKLL